MIVTFSLVSTEREQKRTTLYFFVIRKDPKRIVPPTASYYLRVHSKAERNHNISGFGSWIVDRWSTDRQKIMWVFVHSVERRDEI